MAKVDTESALELYVGSERSLLATESSIPLYYQLYRFLKGFIEQGPLRHGERFPSEDAIAATFGVSRPTANRAVQELVERGWLARERGRGTFVQDQQLGSLSLLSGNLSLTEQFPPATVLQTTLVKREVLADDVATCELLGVPDGTPILKLRRLRAVNQQPVMVCDSFMEATRFRDLSEKTFVRGSLYATFEEKYGFTIERSERKLTAQELVDQDIALLLDVPLFSPVLLLTGLTYIVGEERPLEHMVAHVRECISFSNTVRRKTKPASAPGTQETERPQG
jgi:GntR family transcriptional regulator